MRPLPPVWPDWIHDREIQRESTDADSTAGRNQDLGLRPPAPVGQRAEDRVGGD